MYGNFEHGDLRSGIFSELPKNHGFTSSLLIDEQIFPVDLKCLNSFQFKVTADRSLCDTYYPGLLAILKLSPTASLDYTVKVQITNIEPYRNHDLSISLRVMNDRFVVEPKYKPIILSGKQPLSG